MTTKPMVVIGTGLAGYMFAKEWRKLNSDQPLVMITRDDGHFYSKPLLSNAVAKGKSPAELVTTPVGAMCEQLNATIYTETTVERIDTDQQTVHTANATIEYDTLVLATGATPMTPPLSGDTDALWQVNHLSDYSRFREAIDNSQSIAILGSGLIGCEFANDLINSHQVQVVSLEPTPLIRLLPAEIGEKLQAVFAGAGVQWHLNETAVSVEKNAEGVTLTMQSGKTVTADCVLCAIGIAPDLHLVKTAELKHNRGIIVDELLRTSQPNIYALGDAIEFAGRVEPYIAPLLLCARTLAKNLANPEHAEPIHYPVMPVTVKTPLYPVVCASPAPGTDGHWQCEQVEDSTVARFVGDDDKLHGFAIGNTTGKLRMALMKELA
jgi:rubredoxin-NAD+ reductase